jgi:hypothetical protein
LETQAQWRLISMPRKRRENTEQTEITEQTEKRQKTFRLFRYFRLFRILKKLSQNAGSSSLRMRFLGYLIRFSKIPAAPIPPPTHIVTIP